MLAWRRRPSATSALWSADVASIIGSGSRSVDAASRSLRIRIDACSFFRSPIAARQTSAIFREIAFAPVVSPLPGSSKVQSSVAARGRTGESAPRMARICSSVKNGDASAYCGRGS
jgi:hypothetical protein